MCVCVCVCSFGTVAVVAALSELCVLPDVFDGEENVKRDITPKHCTLNPMRLRVSKGALNPKPLNPKP